MADIANALAKFNPNDKYDPGKIVIFFDARTERSSEDKFSTLQRYWTEGLYRLGWPSFYTPDLDPGMLRLVWYTHNGNEGSRDHPLHRAYLVKEMFDSLAQEGFRPMILGWSGENPFPMIGGSEPPPEPVKPKIKVATSYSGAMSGHGKPGTASTPHDRVMAIIGEEERREKEKRASEVEEMDLDRKEKSGLV